MAAAARLRWDRLGRVALLGVLGLILLLYVGPIHSYWTTWRDAHAKRADLIKKANDNLILNVDSFANYDPAKHGENADGFAAKFRDLGPGNVFRGCRSFGNSDDGWDFWAAANGVTDLRIAEYDTDRAAEPLTSPSVRTRNTTRRRTGSGGCRRSCTPTSRRWMPGGPRTRTNSCGVTRTWPKS